ncbi:MAG TPA: methyltransferase domain-containing protein [Acidimicrobiales bacterium]|nr:methyltransferase domain-containing protein [Acidimicrobiales bacterium]
MDFGPIQVGFDTSVLRPRPWTLAQSEWAAELAAAGQPMLEVGCGAGHIGLAAAVMSGSRLVQVDRDSGACGWAALNAAAAGCADRAEQRCGTAAEVLAAGEEFDVVIADPPYVPSADILLYPEDPPTAIDGGPDGLEKVRSFLGDVAGHVAPGGSVLLQVRGADQVDELEAWLAHPASAPFVVAEARFYGDLRAVVRLAHGNSAHKDSNRDRNRASSS